MTESLLDFDGGWIPYDERGRDGQLLTDGWHEEIETFESRNKFRSDLPEEIIFAAYEVKALGQLLLRPWQQTGSCVGAGGGRAQTHAALGDMIFRGEQEEVHLPFWLPTYGVGREFAGMRGTGSGSYGAAQAKAIERFGHIHRDWDQADKPRIKDGWLIYDGSVELKWSHPKGWRIDRATVEAEAEKNQIRDVTRITTLEGLIQALSQGYGVTAASSFGTRPRVDSSVDLLVGPWNGSWAHQMAWSGYTKRGGKYYVCCDNQWGPTHGTCPTLSKIGSGVYGSFWIPEGDVESVIKRGEVYAHSNTEGFPPKTINWGEFSGFKFD